MGNRKEKKSASTKTNKKNLLLYPLYLGIILSMVYGYYYSDNNQENYDKKNIEKVLEQYQDIKETVLSAELHTELLKIIKSRKECFSSQKSYDDRDTTCKREYVNNIVRLAREKIESAPLRGLFIRSIRECPISGSLCSGENETDELECMDMEARCIEYYLDKYWRGGSFPDGNNYTYQKKNKKQNDLKFDELVKSQLSKFISQ